MFRDALVGAVENDVKRLARHDLQISWHVRVGRLKYGYAPAKVSLPYSVSLMEGTRQAADFNRSFSG